VKRNHNLKLNHLRNIAYHLDSRFEGPFGFRFGWDGIIGLIPGVGDIITSSVSIYIIAQSFSLGVSPSTLVRMAINVGIENVIDMLPLFGNFFDFYWKANLKNIQLLEQHLDNPTRQTIKSRMIMALICFVLGIMLLASVYVSFMILMSFYFWVTSFNA
jgi:hypothetical protein